MTEEERVEEVLWLLLARAQGSGAPGLTLEELRSELGYSLSLLSPLLRRGITRGWIWGRRQHVSGRHYKVRVFKATPEGRAHLESASIPLPAPLPEAPYPFLGRSREVSEIGRGLAEGGVLLVDGVPGVGKTGLVRCALRQTWRTHSAVWTTLAPGSSSSRLLEPAVRFLSSHIPRGQVAGSGPAPSGELGPQDLARLLRRAKHPLVWVVDDLHNASSEALAALRSALESFTGASRNSAVLITQRELPWPVPGGPRVHVSLRGLPRRDALELAQELGLPEDRFESIYRATLGNPRYLRLSARKGVSETLPFADDVLESLSPEQRRSLLPVALSWEGLPYRALQHFGLTNEEAARLISRSVLEVTESGLRMAEPLARRLPELLPWEEVREAHARLVAAPAGLSPSETFCHLVAAERGKEALRLLQQEPPLWMQGSPSRVYPFVLRLAYRLPPGQSRGQVFWSLAQIQRHWGDYVAASTFLERALEELPPRDPRALLAAATLSLTVLRTGHLELARRWARRASPLGKTERWLSVKLLIEGNLLAYQRNYTRAVQRFRLAEKHARAARLWDVALLAMHGLEFAELESGKTEQGLETCLRGMEFSTKRGRGDRTLPFRLDANLARLRLHRWDEAERDYRSILESAEPERARVASVLALLGLAYITGHRGDLESAENLTRQAIARAELVMDDSLTSRAYGALAEWLRRKRQLSQARHAAKRALDLSRTASPSLSLPWALEEWNLLRRERFPKYSPASQAARSRNSWPTGTAGDRSALPR